ncbi:methyltransferase FkbM family [Saccharolobus islandicus L.D.8.5]|uniref:Methyltransferase FkbM family n=2 Tax=Saccharolobus islandicus TaxID=43080 RepID=D2PJ69_SACI9|nr:methyltransferase FkbM family [Sulfolobus islandicus L.D.8.5]
MIRKIGKIYRTYISYFKNISPLIWLSLFSIMPRSVLNKKQYTMIKVKFKNNVEIRIPLITLFQLFFILYKYPRVKIEEDAIHIGEDIIPSTEINWGIMAYLHGWRFRNGIWQFNDIKLKHITFTAIEVFNEKIYHINEIKDKSVVDVGASIGDSAIYFAKEGAKKVIALEPLPSVYNEAKDNVELNNLEDKIILLNAALGVTKGKIKVPRNYDIYMSFNYRTNGYGDTFVDVVTLNDVLKYIDQPYLLKMDCEGCEYDIITKDYENVRKFDNIIFEFHYPKLKSRIIDVLSKDFTCDIIRSSNIDVMFKCIRSRK